MGQDGVAATAKGPAMKAYLLLLTVGILAMAQTLLTPGQIANVPSLPSQFGFSCVTTGPSTVCEIDRAYMLHLVPIPFDGGGTAPPPGPCTDSGGMIVTNEPAAYFCVRTAPGLPALNWIRVAGTNTW